MVECHGENKKESEEGKPRRSGRRRKARRKETLGQEISHDALRGEVATLVKELATEAEEAGEPWAVTEAHAVAEAAFSFSGRGGEQKTRAGRTSSKVPLVSRTPKLSL